MNEYSIVKNQLREIIESSAKNKHRNKIIDDSLFFCERVDRFIKEIGGYAYLCDYINELPEKGKKTIPKPPRL